MKPPVRDDCPSEYSVDARIATAGGQVGPGFAPNITSDASSGIGGWTQQELVQYLRTGSLPPKARAAGSMGEAVEHSFQYLTSADVAAIATYIRTIPPVRDGSDSQSRFGYGTAGSLLGTLPGANGIRSDTGASPTGAELFLGNCASCHASRGQGSKDDHYPSLSHNSVTGAPNPGNLIATILYGVDRKISSGQAYMPGFGGHKTDPSQFMAAVGVVSDLQGGAPATNRVMVPGRLKQRPRRKKAPAGAGAFVQTWRPQPAALASRRRAVRMYSV